MCGLLPYPCGLMSSWAFVVWASVLWAFVLGAFVRIPYNAQQMANSTHVSHIFGILASLCRRQSGGVSSVIVQSCVVQ